MLLSNVRFYSHSIHFIPEVLKKEFQLEKYNSGASKEHKQRFRTLGFHQSAGSVAMPTTNTHPRQLKYDLADAEASLTLRSNLSPLSDIGKFDGSANAPLVPGRDLSCHLLVAGENARKCNTDAK